MSEALQFTILDAKTGAVVRHGTAPDDQFQHQCQDGELIVHGSYPGDAWYWDGQKMVEIPPKPEDENVRWDRTAKSWIDPRTPEMIDEIDRAKKRVARKMAYPDIGDQLDVIWKELAASGGIKTQEARDMLDKINTVKARLPKP